LKSNEIQDGGEFSAVVSQEDFASQSTFLHSPSYRNLPSIFMIFIMRTLMKLENLQIDIYDHGSKTLLIESLPQLILVKGFMFAVSFTFCEHSFCSDKLNFLQNNCLYFELNCY
jgi:hypothetical protein